MMTIMLLLLLLLLIISIKCNDVVKIDEVRQCFDSRIYKRNSIRKVRARFSHTPGRPLIELDTAIDRLDMNHLNTLADCIQEEMPEWFENRLFDSGNTAYNGGNNATFITGIIQEIMPDFITYIKELVAAGTEYAGWRPHPSHLGIRCVEKIVYRDGSDLLYHTETDSIYTLTLMLSRPDQFTGGRFYIKSDINSDDTISASPTYGGGILFNSIVSHGIEPIYSGVRAVIDIEFWPFEDSITEDRRPPIDHYNVIIPKQVYVTPFKKHPEINYDPLEEEIDNDDDEEEEETLDNEIEESIDEYETYETIPYLGVSRHHGFGFLLGSFVGFLFPLFVGISYSKATSLANKNK